jgi:hypothetical protein
MKPGPYLNRKQLMEAQTPFNVILEAEVPISKAFSKLKHLKTPADIGV